jgi:DedD protein
MSPERSRIIWITVAVTAFILAVSIAGVFLFYPRNDAGSAPATFGNVAVPKAADPQDYLATPPAVPDQTISRQGNGDIVVIYGDKPASLPPHLGPLPGGSQFNPDGSVMAQPLEDSASAASAKASGTASATATATATATVAAPAPKAAPAARTVAKAPPAKAVAKAAPVKKPAAEEFWIQAASFTERSKADGLRESLGEKGLAALITVKDINGKSWYRVRIGPYSAKAEADGWVTRVRSVNGCAEAWVSVDKPRL